MPYQTRIEDIHDADVPFSCDILIEFDNRGYETVETFVGSVDLSKVRGCYHPDYAGMTWAQLKPAAGSLDGDKNDFRIAYQPLKRAASNAKNLHRNPGYYLGEDEKHHWSFYELSGEYFISSGVHRTVIGRFFLWLNKLPPSVHGVSVTRLKAPAKQSSVEEKRPLIIMERLKHALFGRKT